jgi:drug/metabolite transporter (DMT)-like permease
MRTFGLLAGLAAASIWGGMYVVSKIVLDIIPPFTLIVLRLLLGAACLALVVLLRGGFRVRRNQLIRVLAVGVVGYGVSIGLQFVGTKLSTAANAALVTSASPAFILLFGVVLLREPVTGRRLAALGLATLGVLVVINPSSATLGGSAFWGNVALLGAALTWGLYSVLVKQASGYLNTLEVSTLVLLGGLPICMPLSWLELRLSPIGHVTPGIVAGVIYLGVVSTALAMYLWNKSLALLDAGIVSLLFFAQPVVGIGLGMTLLGERLGIAFWIGAALIGAGLGMAAWPDGGAPLAAIPGPARADGSQEGS